MGGSLVGKQTKKLCLNLLHHIWPMRGAKRGAEGAKGGHPRFGGRVFMHFGKIWEDPGELYIAKLANVRNRRFWRFCDPVRCWPFWTHLWRPDPIWSMGLAAAHMTQAAATKWFISDQTPNPPVSDWLARMWIGLASLSMPTPSATFRTTWSTNRPWTSLQTSLSAPPQGNPISLWIKTNLCLQSVTVFTYSSDQVWSLVWHICSRKLKNSSRWECHAKWWLRRNKREKHKL